MASKLQVGEKNNKQARGRNANISPKSRKKKVPDRRIPARETGGKVTILGRDRIGRRSKRKEEKAQGSTRTERQDLQKKGKSSLR